jgi:hypothetical protein
MHFVVAGENLPQGLALRDVTARVARLTGPDQRDSVLYALRSGAGPGKVVR